MWLSFRLIFSSFRGGTCTAGAAKSKHGSDNGVRSPLLSCCCLLSFIFPFFSLFFLLTYHHHLTIIITVIEKYSNEWMESAAKLFQENTGTQLPVGRFVSRWAAAAAGRALFFFNRPLVGQLAGHILHTHFSEGWKASQKKRERCIQSHSSRCDCRTWIDPSYTNASFVF